MTPVQVYKQLLEINPPANNEEKNQIRYISPNVKRIQDIAANYGFAPIVKRSTSHSTERKSGVPIIVGELAKMPHPCYLVHGKYYYDSFFDEKDFTIIPQNYGLILTYNKYIGAPNLYVGVMNKQICFFNFATNSLGGSMKARYASFTDFWKKSAGIDFLIQICPYVKSRGVDKHGEISLNIYSNTKKEYEDLGKEYSLQLETKWINELLSTVNPQINSADQLISHVAPDTTEQQDITEI